MLIRKITPICCHVGRYFADKLIVYVSWNWPSGFHDFLLGKSGQF